MPELPVESHNEWDPLTEVIVGRVENARMPDADISLFAVELQDYYRSFDEVPPGGAFPDYVVEETIEDLEAFCLTLTELGVSVQRPMIGYHSRPFSTPDWSSSGIYNYCPRDLALVVGDRIIEAPVALRARYFELNSFKPLFLDYLRRGARWTAAPRPLLLDNEYSVGAKIASRLADREPVFDAANILRMGADLLYLVSSSGNEMGHLWLSRELGERYRVWPCPDIYASTHIDSTISLLRPGLVLLNPSRVDDCTVPEPLRSWDKIWCPEMIDTGYVGRQPYSSVWVGMNILMVRPDLAIVERSQKPLIQELKKYRIQVIPLSLRHSRTLGGGFHCVTLDVRRTGSLESYI